MLVTAGISRWLPSKYRAAVRAGDDETQGHLVRYEVLTVVPVKTTAFMDMTPYNLP